ncbi:MAG: hypothetical protein BRD25_04355, partial [Bacteroidetes bacterium QH_1_61_8]
MVRVLNPVWPSPPVARTVFVVAVLVVELCGGGQVTAQPTTEEEAKTVTDTTAPIIRRVQIEGNEHFSEETLKRQIRTSPNRRILGIPGFTWWRWIYQLGEADWMWERLAEALKSGGEPPAYIDTSTVTADAERLQLYYEQEGFFDASVTSSVEVNELGDRVTVVFRVEAGPATYFRRVRYEGLDALTPAQRRSIGRNTVLDVENGSSEGPFSFRGTSQRYRRSLLLEERQRLVSTLQNKGYAGVSRDSIRAIVDREATPPGSLDVTFRVQTGPQYRFGDVHFRITGTEDTPPRRDTLDVSVTTGGGGRPLVTSHIEDESQLGTELLRRSLQFVPGTVYNQSSVFATKQRLEGAGLHPKYNRHFGIGLGGEYENVNALGGGERFRFRTSASVATGPGASVFSSTQFEASTSLTFPYLIRPFGLFENVFDLTSARTQISLSALTARRNDFNIRIRSRNSGRLRLEMNHSSTLTSRVDVLDLSVSNPDTLSGFQGQFLDSLFVGIEDPVQRAQILEDYTQPQINTVFRYTLQSATANPVRR